MTVQILLYALRDNNDLIGAIHAAPNVRRVILDMKCPRSGATGHGGASAITSAGRRDNDDEENVALSSALDTLGSMCRSLTSLMVTNLSGPIQRPTAASLTYLLTCGITDLELHDTSIQRASADGISNLLRPTPFSVADQQHPNSLADSIRARGSAMIRFALALPALRRLSLSNAALPAADVVALGALTQLEELRLVGSMECSDAASVNAVYGKLLTSLTHLRTLVLPMVVAGADCEGTLSLAMDLLDSCDAFDVASPGAGLIGGMVNMVDDWGELQGTHWSFDDAAGSSSSDESFCDMFCAAAGMSEGSGQSDTGVLPGWRFGLEGMGMEAPRAQGCSAFQSTDDGVAEIPGAALSSGYCFPQQLGHLEIPLCAFNAAVFQAACCAYNTGDSGSLRSLCISCAPGYSAWEGSFLNSIQDFAALARLTSLESLHLSLELEGPGAGALRRGNLRTCLQQLHALTNLKDLRISKTRQPLSFSIRKVAVPTPSLLSYVLPEETRTPIAGPSLPALPCLGGFSTNPIISLDFLPRFYVPTAAPSTATSPTPSPAAVSGLLVHWPRLQTLVVGCHNAVRNSADNSLRLLGSLDELMAHNEKEGRQGLGSRADADSFYDSGYT